MAYRGGGGGGVSGVPEKRQLLAWLNDFLASSGRAVDRVERLCDGVAYCQIFDACWSYAGRPSAMPLKRVIFEPRNEVDWRKNLQLLEDAFRRERIEKFVPVDDMAQGRMQHNVEFLQWVYSFVNTYYPDAGAHYDAAARRQQVEQLSLDASSSSSSDEEAEETAQSAAGMSIATLCNLADDLKEYTEALDDMDTEELEEECVHCAIPQVHEEMDLDVTKAALIVKFIITDERMRDDTRRDVLELQRQLEESVAQHKTAVADRDDTRRGLSELQRQLEERVARQKAVAEAQREALRLRLEEAEKSMLAVCAERDMLQRELSEAHERNRELAANVAAMRADIPPPDEGTPPELATTLYAASPDLHMEPEPELARMEQAEDEQAAHELVRTSTPAMHGQFKELYSTLLGKDPSLAEPEQLLKLVKQTSQHRSVQIMAADRLLDDAPEAQPLSTFLPSVGLGNRIDEFRTSGFTSVADLRRAFLVSEATFLKARDLQRVQKGIAEPRGFPGPEDLTIQAFLTRDDVNLGSYIQPMEDLGYRYLSDLKDARVDGNVAPQDNPDGTRYAQVAEELRAIEAAVDVWEYEDQHGNWKPCIDQTTMTERYLSRSAVENPSESSWGADFISMEQVCCDTLQQLTKQRIRGSTQAKIELPPLPADLRDSLDQLKYTIGMLPPERQRLDDALQQEAVQCSTAKMTLVKDAKKHHKRQFSINRENGTMTWKRQGAEGKTRAVLGVGKELPDDASLPKASPPLEPRLGFVVVTAEERMWIIADDVFQKQEWLFAIATAAEIYHQRAAATRHAEEAGSPQDRSPTSGRKDKKALEALQELQTLATGDFRHGKDRTLQLASACMKQFKAHRYYAPLVAYCCQRLHEAADGGSPTVPTAAGELVVKQKGIAVLALRALTEHPAAALVQQHGKELLRVLLYPCYSEACRPHAAAKELDDRGPEVGSAIGNAMRTRSENEELVHRICETVHFLSTLLPGHRSKPVREAFGKDAGGVKSIVRAMQQHPDSVIVQKSGCRALHALCGPVSRGDVDEVAEIVRKNGAAGVAKAASRRFPGEEWAAKLTARIPDEVDVRGGGSQPQYVICSLKVKQDASAKSKPTNLKGKTAQLCAGDTSLVVSSSDQSERLWHLPYSSIRRCEVKDGSVVLEQAAKKAASGHVYKIKPAEKGEADSIQQVIHSKCQLKVENHGRFELRKHVPSSHVHLEVKQLLESTWNKAEQYKIDMDAPIVVQEITNSALQARYDEYKATLNAPGEKLLFHGCAAAHVMTIPGEGFLKKYWTSSAGSWQRFQPGFYFALHSSKSHDYPLPEMQSLRLGQHRRQMLLCKVASGREYRTSENMDRPPPQPEYKSVPPPGYDSVHGEASKHGPMNYDELVVYEEAAVLPWVIVEYGFMKLKHD